jgi:hypothetical protein
MAACKTQNMFEILADEGSECVVKLTPDYVDMTRNADTLIRTLPHNVGMVKGQREVRDDGMQVKLLDPETNELHVWHRKGHTLFRLDPETGAQQYLSSEQMVPCSHEMKYGFCPQRDDVSHRKHNFHFTYTRSRFCGIKPVCRYSQNDKNNLCWERFNAEHNKVFHHEH